MAANPARDQWWRGSTIYQLYVRSWRDADGDGYGDLAGVRSGLDYLVWLGVDAIWLSPTMPSPDDDWGYDVSDYRGVHPELGTLDDLDALVAEAAERGLKVLLDLVPNHTSDEHAWFVDASSGRDSDRRDYYVWADPSPLGGVPNNWLDSTGASAWTLDERSGQYYLHNFLDSQPDLNWWNPAVHEEFTDILRFWFERGVAGFRIDVAHGLYKDAELRDEPPLPEGSARDDHFGLERTYSANRPEVHRVYRDWRAIAESYEPAALLLGETWVHDMKALSAFYGSDDELQLAFNFPFLFAPFGAESLRDVVEATLADIPAGACPVWTASNHDVSRFATRWCDGDEARIRLALVVLLTLPGAAVLYYGDELGATDVEIPVADQRDAMTRAGRGGKFNRDRSRTPMRWDASPGGGFSAPGVRPWLPFGPASAPNVADSRDDEHSVLALTRALVALRREHLGGEVAPLETLESKPQLWRYRVGPLVVSANFSPSSVRLAPPVVAPVVSSDAGRDLAVEPDRLGPFEAVVALGS